MRITSAAHVLITITLLCAMLLSVACAPTYKMISFDSGSGLAWPEKPEIPRIAYIASFYHPDHFGIKKGFFSWLGEIFTGEEERRLIRPMAITQTSNNVLFVADPGVKGVHRFDLKNKRYSLVRLGEGKILPSPVGMAVDKNDDVYVVDSELAQLFIIKNNKNEAVAVSLDELLTQPTSVAIDSNDNSLYITDTATHQIKQFSSNGKLKSIIGKRGTAEGEFNYPTMIWKDKAGQLYVTDSLNFRIQIFDHDGKFSKTFGKQGGGSGELSRPKGVATDNDGHVYVVDGLFHVFQLFDKTGKFLLHVGGQGQGEGEFWLPSGIFIKDNIIYVADSFNRRVQVFRYLGEPS